jgi:hypothetical protein
MRSEAPFPRYLPDGCAVHFNRLSRPGTAISSEFLLGMIDSVERTARDLAELRPEVMLYACRTGTFLGGPALHADIGDRIRRVTDIPGITAATATLEALYTLGAKRVFMVTPYPARINDKEVEFLAYYGITVPCWDSFLHVDSRQNVRRSSVETARVRAAQRGPARGCGRRLHQLHELEVDGPACSARSGTRAARDLVQCGNAVDWPPWDGCATPHLPLGRLYGLESSWTICPQSRITTARGRSQRGAFDATGKVPPFGFAQGRRCARDDSGPVRQRVICRAVGRQHNIAFNSVQ